MRLRRFPNVGAQFVQRQARLDIHKALCERGGHVPMAKGAQVEVIGGSLDLGSKHPPIEVRHFAFEGSQVHRNPPYQNATLKTSTLLSHAFDNFK